jgi:hypothetical protein
MKHSVIVSDMKQILTSTAVTRRPERPTSYKTDFCQRVIALMAAGRSLDGCAALLGIHPNSLKEWQRVRPEFPVP